MTAPMARMTRPHTQIGRLGFEGVGAGAVEATGAETRTGVGDEALGRSVLRSTLAMARVPPAGPTTLSAGRKIILTPPNRTSGDPSSLRSVATRWPPTYVPFVEPTSQMYHPSSRRCNFACV